MASTIRKQREIDAGAQLSVSSPWDGAIVSLETPPLTCKGLISWVVLEPVRLTWDITCNIDLRKFYIYYAYQFLCCSYKLGILYFKHEKAQGHKDMYEETRVEIYTDTICNMPVFLKKVWPGVEELAG